MTNARAVRWKAPNNKSEYANNMRDILVSMSKNDILVYYVGKSGKCRESVILAAMTAASGIGALVQRPHDKASNANRVWSYMIQKS